jgi:hypothetical protein
MMEIGYAGVEKKLFPETVTKETGLATVVRMNIDGDNELNFGT